MRRLTKIGWREYGGAIRKRSLNQPVGYLPNGGFGRLNSFYGGGGFSGRRKLNHPVGYLPDGRIGRLRHS